MKKFFESVGLAAGILISLSCDQPKNHQPKGSRVGSEAARMAPIQPDVFRELRFHAIEGAPKLLERVLSNPLRESNRTDLAKLYSDAGYLALADFFLQSAGVLSDEPAPFEVPRVNAAWVYPAGEDPNRPLRHAAIAQEVVELLMASEYTRAVERADEALAVEGFSARLGITWAYATLWKASVSPDEVDLEVLEQAVRLYVTGVEETLSYPPTLASKSDAYEMLSNFMLALGDLPSAYVAASTSKSSLEPGPTLPDWALETTLQRLNERIQSLEARMGLTEGLSEED